MKGRGKGVLEGQRGREGERKKGRKKNSPFTIEREREGRRRGRSEGGNIGGTGRERD